LIHLITAVLGKVALVVLYGLFIGTTFMVAFGAVDDPLFGTVATIWCTSAGFVAILNSLEERSA